MSGGHTLVAALLLSGAVVLAPWPSAAHKRLRRLLPSEERAVIEPNVYVPRTVSPAATRWACAAAGVGAALLMPWIVGLVLGVAIALLGPVALGRLEFRHVRLRRSRVRRDLALMLDLFAACLSSGAPVAVAARSVADALHGPLADDLRAIAVRLDLGADPSVVWRGFGGDDRTRRIGLALARGSLSGTASSSAMSAMADDQRSVVRREGEAAARRVAVRVAAPLGLCFLPAFVLLAIVPAVLGALGPLVEG